MSETERSPLAWPSHRPRTRREVQKHNGAWKLTWTQYLAALQKELSRMKVTRWVLTWNDPKVDPLAARDPGVALWFDRQKADNNRWQDILGLDNPWPTVAEVDTAYKRILTEKNLHPDRHQNDPKFDVTPFNELTRARQEAIAFIRGTAELPKGYVIPSDQFKEPKQNLYAIIGTLRAFRTIERLGATQLYEGALQGMAGALPQTASEDTRV